MIPPTHCLECNAPLTPAETQGLCARCLLKLGFASQLGGSSLPASPGNSGPPPMMPFSFGDYRIVRLLGKGGMGAVYEAEDTASGRRVALKALGHSLDSPDTRKRFLREGRLAASINHPNTVYVYGTEEIEGAPVITMELIPGGTLQERVKKSGPMPVSEAVDAILQIIAGLEAAHAVGILHRDIKPSNCFIDPSGVVKVGDFGLSISTTSRGDSALTIAGSVLGTPEFSSPEQLRGEALDLRADIYSVGMTLYYLLTAQTAFRGENVVQLLATVLDKAAPSPRTVRPEIPEALAQIILRCLEKQAGDRCKNYDELRRALLPFTSTAPTPATLGRRFLAGVIDTLLLMFLTGFLPIMLSEDLFGMMIQDNETAPGYRWFLAASLLALIAYYAVSEGRWGATPGKALVGLRVGGLDRTAPGIPRALLRALIYLVPAVIATFLNAPVKAHLQAVSIALGALAYLYPLLLALTARRQNGFATMIDLITKTRVIEKAAYQPRESVTQAAEPVGPTEALPMIGAYHVLATLAATERDELVLGYDTKLLRRVWIRKTTADAAPVPAALRNAARPGRLRWLQGQRAESGSWDAFEAAPGTPLTALLATPQLWKNVRHWLLDLATELDAATRDGSLPDTLSLDRVWITAEGGAKLLDFPAPGSAPVAAVEPGIFLNQVAISALEGRLATAEEARTREPRLPIAIRARGVLQKLRIADYPALVEQLKALVRQVPHVTHLRRLGLVAGCMLPALLMLGFMLAGSRFLGTLQRQSPEVTPLMNALIVHSLIAERKLPTSEDPKVSVESAEIFIASRFGNFIRDPKGWNSFMATVGLQPKMRAEAERIVQTYPDPSPAEVKRARAVLAPALDARGNLSLSPDMNSVNTFSTQVVWWAAGGVMVWAALFSLVAGLFRGGLLMRALGIAVVRRDGADASRWRMLWRACVAWSWLPLATFATALLNGAGHSNIAVIIVGLPLLGLLIWSAAIPRRSLPDRLAGTWLVPR